MDVIDHPGMKRINKDLPEGHALLDFRNFLFLVWEFLALPEPTPIQYDLAHEMQLNSLNPLLKRKGIIQAPRGLGKSYICSAFAVWRLRLDRDQKIMVVSGNEARAADFTQFTQKLIDGMDLFEDLRGGSRKSALSFDVAGSSFSHSPSMKAAGIMGSITGGRATLIIGDDCETPSSVETQGSREKLDARVKEFNDIIIPESQEVIFLGTPQGEESVYNKLQERNHKLMVWTAETVTPSVNENHYGGAVVPFCVNDEGGLPTEPTRFSKVILETKKIEHGRTRYAQQYMLLPHLMDADKFPLKINDLIVTDVDGERAAQYHVWSTRLDRVIDLPCVGFNGDKYHEPIESGGGLVEFTGSLLSIDPAGRGADETSYCVTKMLNGYVYVMAAGGFKGGYEQETLEKLCLIAKKHKVNMVEFESNFGDAMFGALLKPVMNRIYPCEIEEKRSTTNKEARICDTLEPLMNSHKLVINKRVVQDDHDSIQSYRQETRVNYSLFYQMSRLTRDKGCLNHDDRIDVLAMGCAYWLEAVQQDAKKMMAIRKDEAFRAELESFNSYAWGGKAKEPTFF